MNLVDAGPIILVFLIVALILAVPVTAAVFLIGTVMKISRTQKEMMARLDELTRKVEGR